MAPPPTGGQVYPIVQSKALNQNWIFSSIVLGLNDNDIISLGSNDTPRTASGKKDIFVFKIRLDTSVNALNMQMHQRQDWKQILSSVHTLVYFAA